MGDFVRPKKTPPLSVPILVFNRFEGNLRGTDLREDSRQFLKELIDAGSDIFKVFHEWKVGFYGGILKALCHEAVTAQIKKKSPQSLMGNRIEGDRDFHPPVRRCAMRRYGGIFFINNCVSLMPFQKRNSAGHWVDGLRQPSYSALP